MENMQRRQSPPELWVVAIKTVEEEAGRASYAYNFQPTYLDHEYLVEAVHELYTTQPVTRPEYVEALQTELADIATGHSKRPIVITGNCAERVLLKTPIHELAANSLAGLELVNSSLLENPLQVRRERGQNTKPRSEETEILPDGNIVISYMGDAINDMSPHNREPDPARLVAAGIQALDIENELTETVGEHIPAAHEALNLLYEKSFLRSDSQTNKKYLLSADLPWIGLRTNAVDSDHTKLLASVENPIGIKLGADTSEEHVEGLSAALNPTGKPGKLVLMPRFGIDNVHRLPGFLRAVKTHAPGSLILYDIHGSTQKLEDGTKTRLVDDIVEEISVLSQACHEAGLRLNGVHLETTTDPARLECIDHRGQRPTHPGGIDPQLNPRQTKFVLDQLAAIL